MAAEKQGYGNLMLTPEQQAVSVEELPDVFRGRNDATHVRLAVVSEEVLEGALHTAWKLRVEKNAKAGRKRVSRETARAKSAKKKP